MTSYDIAVALPDIDTLRARCRALAMLDAIVSPEWESRYYSFDSDWAAGTAMAAMRNGSGDDYSIVFTPAGVFIRGFDHESPMSPVANDDELWPGLIDRVPEVFAAQLDEPAFRYDGLLSATFCLWRQPADDRWHTGVIEFPPADAGRADPDGSELLRILCQPDPAGYRAFAADYYAVALDTDAADRIYALRPLDDTTVTALNPQLTMADVAGDAAVIGYPLGPLPATPAR